MPQLEHDQDIITVCNIDTNCSQEDSEEGFTHGDYFQVKYGGVSFRIAPGETRRMPRYVAKHFAKHLADHILIRSNKKVNDLVERPRLISQILLNVDTFHLPEMTEDEAMKLKKQFEDLNRQEDNIPTLEAGVVNDPMMGNLKPAGPSLEDVMKNSGAGEAPEAPATGETSIFNPEKPLPPKKDLLEAAHKMGLDVTGKESSEDLVTMLKSF